MKELSQLEEYSDQEKIMMQVYEHGYAVQQIGLLDQLVFGKVPKFATVEENMQEAYETDVNLENLPRDLKTKIAKSDKYVKLMNHLMASCLDISQKYAVSKRCFYGMANTFGLSEDHRDRIKKYFSKGLVDNYFKNQEQLKKHGLL